MKKDERITIQESSTTYNDYNEEVTTWANISDTPTMWAEPLPRTGNEDFQDSQKTGFQRYDFKVLWRGDLDVEMRINWDGRYWDIQAIEPLHKGDRHKELLITAEWTQGQYE